MRKTIQAVGLICAMALGIIGCEQVGYGGEEVTTITYGRWADDYHGVLDNCPQLKLKMKEVMEDNFMTNSENRQLVVLKEACNKNLYSGDHKNKIQVMLLDE